MKNITMSIRKIIGLSFIVLLVSTLLIIGYIVFSNWKASTDSMIAKIEKDTQNAVLEKIEELVNIPLKTNEMNQHLIQNGVVDLNNKKQREAFMAGVIRSSDEAIYSFSYGMENGDYYGARRNIGNEIEIYRSTEGTNNHSRYYTVTDELTEDQFVQDFGEFDPRNRDWYIMAKEKKEPVFSSLYKHFVKDDFALSAAYPIFNEDGSLKGVLGTHITLARLNGYLKEIIQETSGTAYIVEKHTDQLVANSLENPNFSVLPDGKVKRTLITEISNQSIIDAYQAYKQTSKTRFIFDTEIDKLHIQFSEFNREGLNWLIITAIPVSLFTQEINVNINTAIALSFLALIISILIYLKSTDVILKPIKNLIETTQAFSKGDLQKRAEIIKDDEIGMLSVAFNNMAEELHIHIDELAVSREKLINILESITDGFFTLDKEWRFTYINSAQHLPLNKVSVDLLGQCIWDLYPETRESLKSELSKVFKEEKPVYFELQSVYEDRVYEVRAYPNDDGLSVFTQDITEKKLYEKELIRLNNLNLIGQMAAGISHEIRNPMATVKGFLQLLLPKKELAPHKDMFNLMIEELDRANSIITEFLSMTRSKPFDLRKTNLNSLIYTISSLIEADALSQDKYSKVDLHSVPELLLNEKEIRQLILNLCRNGLEAMSKGKYLMIRTYLMDESVVLDVIDQGPGISPDVLKNIGTPFFTTKQNGTGLGLGICYGIAERHNAKIEIQTGPEGTTFSVKFRMEER